MSTDYVDSREPIDKIDKINKINKINKIDKINKIHKIHKINKIKKREKSRSTTKPCLNHPGCIWSLNCECRNCDNFTTEFIL